MCLIIHKPLGAKLDRKIVTRGAESNSDGWGVFWTSPDMRNGDDHVVWWLKSPTMKGLAKQLDVIDTPDVECGIHLRLATHGGVNHQNCHPFVHNGFVLAHNGVIHTQKTLAGESDTAAFFREHAVPAYQRTGDLGEAAKQIEKIHGAGQRMLLAEPGRMIRTGAWTENGGNWYSNSYSFHDRSYSRYWRGADVGGGFYDITDGRTWREINQDVIDAARTSVKDLPRDIFEVYDDPFRRSEYLMTALIKTHPEHFRKLIVNHVEDLATMIGIEDRHGLMNMGRYFEDLLGSSAEEKPRKGIEDTEVFDETSEIGCDDPSAGVLQLESDVIESTTGETNAETAAIDTTEATK